MYACTRDPSAISFAYRKMANPTTVATTPVKSLPAARPRAPPVLPWLPVVPEGRGEDEEGDPVDLGGVEDEEELDRGRETLEVGPIGRELAPSICC